MNGELVEIRPSEISRFLHEMYMWGIEVIRLIQRLENPVLTALVKFITALGTEALYVPLILFIFWRVNEKQGFRFGILIILSAWVNAFLKDLLRQPRPFNLEPSLGLASESSYGAPSGHAQMSLIFWIAMAVWLSSARATTRADETRNRRGFIWAASITFILIIGFSRLYLGVHFPTDLFAGWITGGLILVVWFAVVPRLEKSFAAAGSRFQNITAAALAFLMNGVYPRDRSLPALLLGFCLGYTMMKRRYPISPGKKPDFRITLLRCLFGFGGMGVIYLGLRLIFPGEESLFKTLWGNASPFYELGRFIRYGIIGFWASAGAPFLFRRLGLSSSGKET
jgi:membrane-associated phospholipid phosphatase